MHRIGKIFGVKFAVYLIGCIGWVSAAIAQGQSGPTSPKLLNDGWQVAQPSDFGFDPDALNTLTEDLRAGIINNVHAVIVERRGTLVYEKYFKGRDERWGQSIGLVEHTYNSLHDLRSVSKSVTSVLLGAALGSDFDRELKRSITEFFPDKRTLFGSGLEKVTLHHVLTMTAGLEWNEMEVPYTSRDNDELRLYYTADPTGLVLKRAVRETPGSRWYYNGGLTHLAAGIVQRKAKRNFREFAEERLFNPLGIQEYEWLGSQIWPSSEPPSGASGLRLRARDLAKIALLARQGGHWNGEQLIPKGWLERSFQRYVETIPWDPSGTFGYGYMWYPGEKLGPKGYKAVRAVGNGDQRIFIFPEQEITITVFAGNYNNFRYRAGETIAKRVMAARVDQ